MRENGRAGFHWRNKTRLLLASTLQSAVSTMPDRCIVYDCSNTDDNDLGTSIDKRPFLGNGVQCIDLGYVPTVVVVVFVYGFIVGKFWLFAAPSPYAVMAGIGLIEGAFRLNSHGNIYGEFTNEDLNGKYNHTMSSVMSAKSAFEGVEAGSCEAQAENQD